MKSRTYNYKDVDMIMAARTIAMNFLAHLPFLTALRTNWDDSYATNLLTRIDAIINEFIGVDNRKALKEATERVQSIHSTALNDLTFLKMQILTDFPGKAESILKKLGFRKLKGIGQDGNQEQLIEMLLIFKKEMSEKVKTEICSKGINPDLVDRICENADQLKESNTIQESLKTSSKQVTDNVRGNLDEIYKEVAGICKMARLYYKSEPLKQEQFVFSGIVENMNNR